MGIPRRCRAAVSALRDAFGMIAAERGPWARVVRITGGVRIFIGLLAVAVAWLLPSTRVQRITLVALVGAVYLPYSLLAARLQGRGASATRITTAVADLLVVFMFQAFVPPVRFVALMGYLLITAFNACVGGATAGLAVALGALGLTGIARWVAPEGTGEDPFTLVMFAGVLASLTLMIDAGTRERRESAVRQVSVVSHEMRTPLSSIEGWATTLLLRWDTLDDPARLQALGSIARNSEELHMLADDLVEISRVERAGALGSLGRVDVRAVVEEFVSAHAPMFEDHRVSMRGEGGWLALVDSRALERVLANLLGNAVKYAPAGSEIRVLVAGMGNAVRVSVADRGPGIPPEEQAHVFEPFFRGAGAGAGGAGIGLTLAKRYVEKAGGRLWVESRPGSGSTFSFTLPLAAGREIAI